MKGYRWIGGLLGLWSAPLLAADGAAEPAMALSYEGAMQQAVAQNPTILQADADLARADGQLLAARAPFGPQLTASGALSGSTQENNFLGFSTADATRNWSFDMAVSQYFSTGTALSLSLGGDAMRYLTFENALTDELPPPSFSTALRLTVSQPLLQGVRTASNLAGIREAGRARTISEAQALAARQRVLAQVAHAYWALHYQHRLVEIAQESLTAAEEQARVIAALVGDGRLAPVEGTRARATVAEAEKAVLESGMAERAAADALLLLIGAEPGGAVSLQSRPPEAGAVPTLEQVIGRVLAGNPDLMVLRMGLEAAAAALSDARHALLPELNATASAGLSGYEETVSGSLTEMGSGDLSSWTVGANLALPLLNRADRGALGQREAEVERARLSVVALEAQLHQQVLALIGQIAIAERRIGLAALNVSLRRETLAVEQARLAEGRVLQQQVILAMKDLNMASVEEEKARIDHAGAMVDLAQLMGAL